MSSASAARLRLERGALRSLFLLMVISAHMEASARYMATADAHSVSTSSLKSLSAQEVSQRLTACEIDERPYPTDSGPLYVGKDQNAEIRGGFAGPRRLTYEIAGNRMSFSEVSSGKVLFTLMFFKNDAGRLYYLNITNRPPGFARPLRLICDAG